MDKIYLKDNYIVTELSGVTAVFPKNYSSYSENASGFYINSTFPVNNQRAVYIDFTRVASIYNEAGTTAYTIATLRSFLLTNTGFKSPSGGSGGVWGGITGTLSSQTDLQSALDAKQDDLISGTNIKTLEGQSLLGAGNIDLTKSDVGLSNVDNTSDLNKPISTLTQTALNAKQNTLTLTTTGTSGAATLVGSTLNIPQYSGGGGLQGLHNVIRPQTSQVVTNRFTGTSTSFNTYVNNIIRLHPYISSHTITTTSLTMQVLTGQANALGRILIYSDLNSSANTKLYESASLNFATSGMKTATISFTFTAGTIYWIGFQNFLNPTSATISSVLSNQLIPFLGTIASNSQFTGYQTTIHAFGSAPTTMGTMTPTDQQMPLLLITL
jgi:hypothetical protein